MNHSTHNSWQPIEGLRATRYMLITVVSLAITVMLTRLYLELTGYPQLGNDTFHIAHALWGGLLQAIAAILMLIYLNRWVFMLAASLSGIGIGLFVDEIGKFITQTNDYFFPLAAPLIYIVIILGVMLYLYIRREDHYDARGSMYLVLDNMKSLLDQNMDRHQYADLQAQLKQLANQTERSDIASMAQGLLQALPQTADDLPDYKPNLIDRLMDQFKQFEEKYFSRTFIRRVLMLFFLVTGLASMILVVSLAVILTNPDYFEVFVLTDILQVNPLVNSPYSLNWYLAWIVVTIAVGILYLIAFVTLLRHRDRLAMQIATIALVISLTIDNTLSFYFNQFSVMLTSLALLGLLMMVMRYRIRFLHDGDPPETA